MKEKKDYFCLICQRHMRLLQKNFNGDNVYICPDNHKYIEEELLGDLKHKTSEEE